jgi:flagellar basal-body rod modification protein FlgD
MATGIAGIWNQLSASRASTSVHPMDSQTGSTSSSDGSDSDSISANDFLTLLVTEMQNQDPTADTDPNEYIDQLVQINSLEQLVSINQTLTADSNASASGNLSKASVPGQALSALQSVNPSSAAPAPVSQKTLPEVAGNLTAPSPNPAALRVARSLETPPDHKILGSGYSITNGPLRPSFTP